VKIGQPSVPVVAVWPDNACALEPITISLGDHQRPASGSGSGIDAEDTDAHEVPGSALGQDFVVDIEVGPHILHVVVVVERLHQLNHPLCGLSFQAGGA